MQATTGFETEGTVACDSDRLRYRGIPAIPDPPRPHASHPARLSKGPTVIEHNRTPPTDSAASQRSPALRGIMPALATGNPSSLNAAPAEAEKSANRSLCMPLVRQATGGPERPPRIA